MWFRVVLLIGLICAASPVGAQSWTFDFPEGQTVLTPDGYRTAGQIAALTQVEPRQWEVVVRLPENDEPLVEQAAVWRLRSVFLELATRGVSICQLRGASVALFGPDTPPGGEPSAGRVVVEAIRVSDDPLRSCHRDRPSVYFASGSADLTPEGRFLLAYYLAGSGLAGVRARVEAFADTAGDPSANMHLSQARADSVRRELFRLGVPWNDIETVARGESNLAKPTSDGVSEADNRRAYVWLRWP